MRVLADQLFRGTEPVWEPLQNLGKTPASTRDDVERDNTRLVEAVLTNRLDMVEEDIVIREVDRRVDRSKPRHGQRVESSELMLPV